MNTTSILIKTDPKVKKAAQKTAEEMGISLTSVINHYLKQFIQTKSITFSIDNEVPNQYMTNSLKQSEEDVVKGRVVSFASPKEELEYLKREIKDEKQKALSR